MPKKKIWIPLVLICIIGIIIGTYKTGALANFEAKKADEQTVSQQSTNIPSPETEQKNEQEQKSLSTQETDVNTGDKVDTIALKEQGDKVLTDNKFNEKIDELIANGEMTEAKENGIYDQKKPIIIDKKIVVVLEKYGFSFDDISLSNAKYYILADFSILNLSATPYNGKLSNFIVTDSSSYTYRPTLKANTNGDIEGEITQGEMKRAQIAFEVPTYDRFFELKFKTGIDNIKTVRFKIDTSTLIPQDKLMPHE